MYRAIGALLLLLVIGGCGGNADTKRAPASTESAAPAQTQDKSGGLLSTQREALEESKGVQAILDKDAEKKKKALENLN